MLRQQVGLFRRSELHIAGLRELHVFVRLVCFWLVFGPLVFLSFGLMILAVVLPSGFGLSISHRASVLVPRLGCEP